MKVADLTNRISTYQTNSKLAQEVQNEMIEEIKNYPDYMENTVPEKNLRLVRSLTELLRKLEVDLPQGQAHPQGGALSQTEDQIHQAMFEYLFQGRTLDDNQLGFMIHYFMAA